MDPVQAWLPRNNFGNSWFSNLTSFDSSVKAFQMRQRGLELDSRKELAKKLAVDIETKAGLQHFYNFF